MKIRAESVREYFDGQIQRGRRLLPDPETVSGLGTWLKYASAAALMAEPRFRRILDLGCNRGSLEYFYETRSSPRHAVPKAVIGVDPSGLAINQAAALGLAYCSFAVADGLSLPFSDESFDLVIMVEVIEHVPDKETLMAEVARVLRPGGLLYLTTPNPHCYALRLEDALWNAARRALGKPQLEKDEYIDAGSLTGLLERAGLRLLNPDDTYCWPRVFIYFRGWAVFPPLPPGSLMRYQRWWISHLEHTEAPQSLKERLMLSVRILAEKD
ncbi:MAG TPA: class I SAM-dependent methyltransferase [Anaerolineae bacterium]|nr:class I SAM-dependent methyltransferase [Anaerolineae bacterium]